MRAWLAAVAALLAMQAGAARAQCKVEGIATFPVTMVGTQPLIHTQINGIDTLFMVDSGAFFSTIDPASAAQLKLPVHPLFDYNITGIGGSASMSATTVKTFTLANVPIRNVQFLVGGGTTGGGAAGLLGQNVLRIGDVEYDLAAGVIRLMRSRDCGHANLAYWAGDKPFGLVELRFADEQQPHTRGQVEVNGVPLQAIFDTGASTSILDVAAARRAGIRTDGPGVTFAGYSRGVGRGTMKTWAAPVASFGIGGEVVKNTRLKVGDLGLTDVQMLVGADFFLSHHVYVARSLRRMFFTYNGGPVFSLRPDPGDDDGEPPKIVTAAASTDPSPAAAKPSDDGPGAPKDADGWARRGAAFAARHEWDRAVADYTHAVELDPKESRYLYRRAQARLGARQRPAARKDLDAALALKPEDAEARMLRAGLRLADDDKAGVAEDLDAADSAATPQWDGRLELGGLNIEAERFAVAVKQADLWIASHRDDSRLAQAFNQKCWARAQGGIELDKALTDCNSALRLVPRAPGYLDSRGLVRLRRGEFALAVADYDAVLAQEPKTAWSLYGRGVAKARLGRKAEGEADLAAAAALAPKLADRAKALGIAP